MTDFEAARLLARLSAGYGNRELNDAESELWLEHLAELDPAQAKTAVDDCIRSETWFPSIARFLQVYETHRPTACPECGSGPTRWCAQLQYGRPGGGTCPWSSQWPPVDYAATWRNGLPRVAAETLPKHAVDVKGLPDGKGAS